MSWKDIIKQERMPTLWCPGCGLGMLLTQVAKAFDEMGLNHTNTTAVSGIGCTGRFAGYLNMDTVHGLHGRAVPVAEGIKHSNPKLNVFVISGDGDLTGIGGNHLLHASRRDANITVICADNGIYGMTGGQLAPTTEKGMQTATSPYGSPYEPINIQGIITSNKKHFYARTTVYHIPHLLKCIKEAVAWEGFSFVHVYSHCITQAGKYRKIKSPYQMLMEFKTNFKEKAGEGKLGDKELGIVKNG